MLSNDELLLIYNSAAGNAHVVEPILRHGGNVNVQDEYGNTPLHYAYKHNQLELVSLLLRHNADQNITNILGQRPADLATT